VKGEKKCAMKCLVIHRDGDEPVTVPLSTVAEIKAACAAQPLFTIKEGQMYHLEAVFGVEGDIIFGLKMISLVYKVIM
jgi:hypothetical protein